MGDKGGGAAAATVPATTTKAFSSSTRARGGDWSKSKETPKRRRGKQQESESEDDAAEADEEEEEGDEEEDEEEEEEADEDSETGSDSERERRGKKQPPPATRKPSPRPTGKKTAKDDATRSGKTDKAAPSGRRRRTTTATAKEYASDNGSETTSQGATDDEMNGGRGGSTTIAKAAKPEGITATNTTAPATNDIRERDRERGRGWDRERETERERDFDRERNVRERNSSMTLPSLSRAAMLHMNRGRDAAMGDDSVVANGYSADVNSNSRSAGRRRDRSRSRSRERDNSSSGAGGNNRWNESNQPKENGRGNGTGTGDDDEPMNYAGDGGGGGRGGGGGGGGGDEPGSPNHDGQDVRIMFHGREIYADDLIGLRVAKTFVGHGRFLGQVVKFDEPTSLYTIVYADGDAEELSIENTIQILIQDEIERADPSVPPVPMAFRNDRMPDSPDAGSVTPASSTATVSVPVAPMSTAAMPPPQTQVTQVPPPSQPQPQQPPVYPSRRSSVAFTEREAQFVMGMFENNALPVLLRQGWRVQSNAAGTEQRFYAPPGSFRGAGHVFLSAFDVVELIVFDNELLSACFPQNMHSVILSLFPESPSSSSSAVNPPSRKRGSPAVPTSDGPVDGYDSKRVRGSSGYLGGPSGPSGPGVGVGVTPMGRAGGPGGSMGLPPNRGDDRLVPPMAYRPDDRMDRGDRDRDRDGYGGPPPPQRMASLAAGDRFGPPNGPGRGEPSDSYRRAGGAAGDYRSLQAPLRSMAVDGGPGPSSSASSSSRWAGPPPSGGAPDASEYHHRRPYGDTSEWSDRDPMAGRGGPSTGGYMGSGPGGGRPSSGGNHRSDEPNRGGGVYYTGGDRGLPRGGPGLGRPVGPATGPSGGSADEPMSSYGRYRDSRGPPPSTSGGQYSPGPESFSNRYPPSRGEQPTSDFRGPSAGGRGPPPGMADRFARPLGRGGSLNGGPPGPSGSGGPGGGGRGFSMMDVERNVSGSGGSGGGGSGGGGSGGGYDHPRMDRGRSPHLGGPPSHLQQHYGHHQRTGSNGGAPNPADDSRPI